MKHLKTLSSAILIFLTGISFAQDDFTSLLTQRLSKYTSNYPQEKIYIHFDRDEYYSGEDAFFKVYLLNGITHHRDTLSYVVYVDFIDKNSRLIQQKRIKIVNGDGDGSFTMPPNKDFEIITVKAYTSWMRNFDHDYFFEKKLKLFAQNNQKSQTNENSYDFQLLPESGYLVSGVANRLAYKAVNQSGLGVSFSGRITDGTSIISELKPAHNGMGVVDFIPENGRDYYFEVSFPDGSVKEGKINGIQNDYLLQIDNSQVDFLNLHILVSPDGNLASETVWVVLQSRGSIYFAAQVKLSKPDIKIPVAKFTLPRGIVQCILFDQNGLPKAERLAFVHKPSDYNLGMETSKPDYLPREETEVKISLKDNSGDAASGSFSLNVVDLGQADPFGEYQINIKDYLMLSSEIPGRIENPGYYFDELNSRRNEHLDLLLMTQGWRRFNWNKILEDKEPEYSHFMERGFAVSGQLTNLRGKPLNDGSISMFLYGDQGGLQTTVVNEQGFFAFYELDITDSTEIFLQGKDGKDKPKVKMKIDSVDSRPDFFIPKIYKPILENDQLEDLGLKRLQIREAFNLSGMDQVLEEVVIESKKPKPEFVRKHNQYYPAPTKRINLDDINNIDAYVNVFHFLRGRVAGMNISGSYFNPVLNSRGSGINGSTSIQNNSPLLILVDGVSTPIDIVTAIPIQRIETVDVINNSYTSALYGGTGGMIAIYLKEGFASQNLVPLGTANINLPAFSINKEFYQVDYAENRDLAQPDYRATLHWEPYVKFDSLGNCTVKFFNSDLETDVLINIEGITDTGEPLSANLTYEIKK